jgi:hypothetical protein
MKKKQKKEESEYLAIPAFLLIGIGLGLYVGQVAALTLIGLGVGFAVSAVYKK